MYSCTYSSEGLSFFFFSIPATACASEPVSSTTVVTGLQHCVLHCWSGGWVCWWCSSCVLLWQVAVGSQEESQPPTQPASLYEDVIVTTVVKDKDELELKDIWTR